MNKDRLVERRTSARFKEALRALSPSEADEALEFAQRLAHTAMTLRREVTAGTPHHAGAPAVTSALPVPGRARRLWQERVTTKGEPSPCGKRNQLYGIDERTRQVHSRFNVATAIADPQQVAEATRRSDKRLRLGDGRPLEAVAFAAKDIYQTTSLPTAYGLPGFRHAVDESPIVAALVEQGAFLTCKTITNQLGYGALVNPTYGAVINPSDPGLLTGGSSSGSAAVVAAGLVAFALGSDAGGSCRTPASYCGVVGFKPSRGLLSASGTLALSDWLDTPGLLSRDVRVARAVLGVLARGYPAGAISRGLSARQLRLGFDRDVLITCDDIVRQSISRALRALSAPQIDIVPVHLGTLLTQARDAGWLELAADASARLWSRIECDSSADPALRMRLAAGTSITDEDRQAAHNGISQCLREYDQLLAAAGLDGILLPTSKTTAPRRLPGTEPAAPETFQRAYDATILTMLANVTGAPAVSLPLPRTFDSQPHVGLQVIGSLGGDQRLLAAAACIEQLLSSSHDMVSKTGTRQKLTSRKKGGEE